MERKEEELKRGHWNQAAMAEEFVTLKDVAMDFTLEDWEDLESELDQRDLFWDAALNNYQDLFSFNPPPPSLISQPEVREELEATGTEVSETKNSPLQNYFLEEDLSHIMEMFSNKELNFEACIGENWLDSFLGDPESLPRPVISSKESPTDHRSHEPKSCVSPGPPFCTTENSVISDIPGKNLTPVILKESRSVPSQHDSVQGQEKLYTCSECGESFSQSYHLMQHWIIHARGEPPAWQEQQQGLSQGTHFLTRPGTQSSYKSYVCQECGKGFSQNMYLQWHQKIHTGEKLCKTPSDNLEKPSKSPSDEPGKQCMSKGADSAKLCELQGWDQEKSPISKSSEQEKLHKSQLGDSPLILHPEPVKHQKTPTHAKCFRCKKCGKTFSRAFHLAQHHKAHTQRLYECASCPAVFNLRKHFFLHRKTHFPRTVFQCQECRRIFNRRSALIKHQAVHTGEKSYKCNECGKAFNHSSTLKLHQRTHSGEKPHRCSECRRTFIRRADLTEHQRVHSGFRPHQCPLCARSFSRPSHLSRHLLSHAAERLFGCAKCKETFGHKEQLERHYKIHTIECSYECKQCGEHFICRSTLNCHLSIHIRENTSKKVLGQNSQHTEKCFKNTKCGKAFNHSKYLGQHEKTHTQVTSCEHSPCAETCDQSTRLICHPSICAAIKPNDCTEPERCVHDTSVSEHQPSQREWPFKCDICNRTFKQSAHLSKHQLIHTREKPFKCSECDRAFKQSNYLIQHQKIHTVEKHFECSECGKTFHQKSCLSKHQKIHSGEKPFKCGDCEKAFISGAHLIRHQRIHTGEKPYVCQECGKAFSQSSCLTLHLRIHTGEKPYSCSTCGKTFAQKANQRKHERTHSGEESYACDVCGKVFVFSTHLRQHQRIHTKEKPYCQDCQKAFHSCSALSKHQKLHTCKVASNTAESHLVTAECHTSEGLHLKPAIETNTLQTSTPHKS
ncbi:zinc finger protein 473 isoform X2 [Arvicanthis niloticus]|uniref:zinc finger protein 473 isoform X2 n=1 Tax=Arvicanthis niloticus TaxID=61156 RepID=UPI0014873644|nr:zinc finger protein 473 isoform X2 [Arvicanthis niloticus]XP_034363486.1 zinc finger protein 473 isoform X2 [Arvicanthis niloticus]